MASTIANPVKGVGAPDEPPVVGTFLEKAPAQDVRGFRLHQRLLDVGRLLDVLDQPQRTG